MTEHSLFIKMCNFCLNTVLLHKTQKREVGE